MKVISRACWAAAASLWVSVSTQVAGAERPATPPAADLAELSLEQLMEIRIEKVFSASKYEQKVTRAPAAVTIVTGDEISKYGHRTMVDVMRSVRGLYVSNDDNYSYLGTRGFLRPGDFNTRVLVLVDGHRMNENVYDSAFFGRENTIDVDLVERVEVVRGPSSSIYGSSAFFGIINIVTKRGADLQGGVVSTEVGSYETYKGRVTVGGAGKNGREWIFAASYFTSGGRDQIYFPEFDQRISDNPGAANNGVAENSDSEKALGLFSRVTLGDFSVTGFFNERQKFVPTASYGTVFNDAREQTTDKRGYLDIKYNRELMPDLHLSGRLFYDRYHYFGDYPIDYALPGEPSFIVVNKDFAYGEWAGAEVQLDARIAERHRLVLGGEFRENFHQDQFNYDLEPWADYLSLHKSSRTLGLYAQAEIELRSDVVLNAGVRYDEYFGSFGGTTNPRVGVIYSPTQRTTLKALYGQAFRAPNVYERTFYAAQSTVPALRPETIRTFEAVWEQYVGSYYRFSLSGYRYNLKSLITQSAVEDSDDRYVDKLVFENLDQVRATGAEVEMEGKWAHGLAARVSYARQRATNSISGDELTSSPQNLAKLNVIVPFARESFFAALEAQYHGRVTTLAGQRVDDFVVTNLSLTARQIVKGWEATLSAYNLFDTRYSYPGGEDHLQDVLPQEGRSVRLKLTYSF
jgi:outer membrane receptor for ferrienterochelin and colicins